MNNKLQAYARQEIKAGLEQLPESHKMLFKRMYSYENLDADINDVVDNMEESKLDFALKQVENTLMKVRQND